MSLKIIVTGLAGSGKSSFINYIVADSFEVKLNKLSMSFDFGKLNDEVTLLGINGENLFGPIANQILLGADAIILVIDSTDYQNFETNMKLAQFIHSQKTPLLVFANKVDVPASYPLATLENMFNMYAPVHSGSATMEDGVKEAFYEVLTMIHDFEYTQRPVLPESGLLATDGGKSEMLDVFEYFYGYLQELQSYVISRSYASYDRKIKIDSEEESQILFC